MSDWHILTVTRGGTVSLLKNLTEDVARKTMQRLSGPFDEGDPWSEGQMRAKARRVFSPEFRPYNLGMRMCSDGDLVKIECFGPEGETLVVWPKPADYDDRYAAILADEQAKIDASGIRP